MINYKSEAKRLVIIVAVFIALVALFALAPRDMTSAYADDSETLYAYFYTESEELFATVEVIDGVYEVPETLPSTEGKEFLGWAIKGQMGYLTPGQKYSATADVTVFAVWSAPTEYEAMTPETKKGWHPDPILLTLIIILGIVVLALMFVLIWCGCLKRSIKSLFVRRKNKSINP